MSNSVSEEQLISDMDKDRTTASNAAGLFIAKCIDEELKGFQKVEDKWRSFWFEKALDLAVLDGDGMAVSALMSLCRMKPGTSSWNRVSSYYSSLASRYESVPAGIKRAITRSFPAVVGKSHPGQLGELKTLIMAREGLSVRANEQLAAAVSKQIIEADQDGDFFNIVRPEFNVEAISIFQELTREAQAKLLSLIHI